ncbi:MAG: hypothetical protein AAF688_08900 [Bacteroidota bacterium]
MLKPLLYKCFSMFMAILVLTSSTSFAIEKHFCGETLIDYSFFSEAKGCCSKSTISEPSLETRKSCCNDEQDVIDGVDILKSEFSDEINEPVKISLFQNLNKAEIYLIPCVSAKDFKIKYAPPNLIVDITIEQQVFLI